MKPLASPKGQKNAEAIALVIYQLKKKGLLKYSLLDNDDNIDFNEIKETIEILKGIEDEALSETGRKGATATKDVGLYLKATERLFKDKELINWDKIILDMEKALQSVKEEQEETPKPQEEIKEETPQETQQEIENQQEMENENQQQPKEEKQEKKEEAPNIDVFENL